MGLLSILAAAAAAGATPPTVVNPNWAERPTLAEIAAYFPPLAVKENKTGVVLLECSVTPIGSVHGCKTISEAPQGWGFGEAAIKMQSLFKMSPKTVNGVPVASTIRVPITFAIPRELTELPQALGCFFTYAGDAELHPEDKRATLPAAYFATIAIERMAAAGMPPSSWESFLGNARRQSTVRQAEAETSKADCNQALPTNWLAAVTSPPP